MDMKTAIGLAQQGTTSRETAAGSRRSATRPAQVLLAGRLTALSCLGGADMPMLALARAVQRRCGRAVLAAVGGPAGGGRLPALVRHGQGILVGGGSRAAGGHPGGALAAGVAGGRGPAGRFPRAAAAPPQGDRLGGVHGALGLPSLALRRRQLYRTVDLLLPNSHAKAQQLIRQFQVPSQRVHVVPQGADPRLASADPEPFAARVGSQHFVLYVGSIEPRNNQLGFLLAMRDEDVTIVFLGDPVADCQWYEAECGRGAGPQVHFVAGAAAGDPLRASALAACGCLVVASGVEAPERVALEGGMSGTPLVLFQESPADEYFGHQAIYVEADDLRAVRYGVLAALARKRSASLAEHVRTYFSWSAVAKATREAYGKVLRK